MKRIFSFLLILVFLLTANGCFLFDDNKKESPSYDDTTTTPDNLPGLNINENVSATFNVKSITKKRETQDIVITISFTSKKAFNYVYIFFNFYNSDKTSYTALRSNYYSDIEQNSLYTHVIRLPLSKTYSNDDFDYALFGLDNLISESSPYVILMSKTKEPTLIKAENNVIPYLPVPSNDYLLLENWYLNNNYTTALTGSTTTKDIFVFAKLLPNINIINTIQKELVIANVTIITTFRDFLNVSQSQGSGVVVQKETNGYYILTNHHVVVDDNNKVANSVTIKNYKQQQMTGRVLYARADYDLALIWVNYNSNIELKALTLAKEDPVIGSTIFSMGQPDNQSNTTTTGVVIGYNKVTFENTAVSPDFPAITHTAPIDHGSSGGALLNDNLLLCGINFAGSRDSKIIRNYAIPISKVYEFYGLYNQS